MSGPPSHATRLRVCYVQAYRDPGYVRGRSLRAALSMLPRIEVSHAINSDPGMARYWQAIRALLQARRRDDPHIYVLGFRGHEIAPLVRFLTRGRLLVFDGMMSPYAALSEESKLGFVGRLAAPLWRRLEAAILRRADAVLTDTDAHAAYYIDEFSLARSKILTVPVGAEESTVPAVEPRARSPDAPLRVLFYGSFLPLHGIPTIIEAAGLVASLPVEFRFIGGSSRQARRLHEDCRRAGVSRYTYQAWLPYEDILGDEIPNADLLLGGPFGGTPQARRVVTGKTSQGLASGKATVVGAIDEDTGFVDRGNCLVVDQCNAESLADAIRWACEHRGTLPAIGARGRQLYAERFSTRVVAERLAALLNRLAG